MSDFPVLMTLEYWSNSQLSSLALFGAGEINGHAYVIVNKRGITLLELSDPSSPYYVADGMAIKAGEPADLIREDWLPVYKQLGRERTIKLIANGTTLDVALQSIKCKKIKL